MIATHRLPAPALPSLPPSLHRPPADLSTGIRQRIHVHRDIHTRAGDKREQDERVTLTDYQYRTTPALTWPLLAPPLRPPSPAPRGRATDPVPSQPKSSNPIKSHICTISIANDAHTTNLLHACPYLHPLHHAALLSPPPLLDPPITCRTPASRQSRVLCLSSS